MKRKISQRDVQILSEYMDGQLPEGKKARLETRLKSDRELRASFEELQQTRALLRSLPRMKAPRNFTLTPQMVGKKAPPRRSVYRWMPVFQFSAVLASVLLVLALAGDLFGVVPSAMPVSQSPDKGFEVMSAPEEKTVENTTQAQDGETGGAIPTEGESLRMISPKSASPVSPTITNTNPISGTIPISPGLAAPLPKADATAEAPIDTSTKSAVVQTSGKNLWRLAEATLAAIGLTSILAIFFLRRQAADR